MAGENLNKIDWISQESLWFDKSSTEVKKDLVDFLGSVDKQSEYKDLVLISLKKYAYSGWDLETERTKWWFEKISITSPHVSVRRSEPQIAITIKPDGKISIRVNPYDHYEDFYYNMQNISLDEAEKYYWGFDKIINWEDVDSVYSTHWFEKIEHPKMDDIDLSDYM